MADGETLAGLLEQYEQIASADRRARAQPA